MNRCCLRLPINMKTVAFSWASSFYRTKRLLCIKHGFPLYIMRIYRSLYALYK
jgi:hypothetical protein